MIKQLLMNEPLRDLSIWIIGFGLGCLAVQCTVDPLPPRNSGNPDARSPVDQSTVEAPLTQPEGGPSSDVVKIHPDATSTPPDAPLPTMGYCPISGGGCGCGGNMWLLLDCTNDSDCANHPQASQENLTHCYQGPYPQGNLRGCVGCADDSHCAAGPQNTGKCRLPAHTAEDFNIFTCNRCDADPDCQLTNLGKRCNADKKLCTTCLFDSDCVKGLFNSGKCLLTYGTNGLSYSTCQRCTSDKDCQDASLGQRCDTAFEWCVDCFSSSDCVAGSGHTPFCYEKSCTGCLSTSDCHTAGIKIDCDFP